MLLSHSAGIGLVDFAARFPPEAKRPDLPEHIAQDFALIEARAYGDARRPWPMWVMASLMLAIWALSLADFAQCPSR